MSTPAEHLPLPPLLRRVAGVFRVLRDRGMLHDGTAHPWAVPSCRPDIHAPHFALFVTTLRQLLTAADERTRRRLEQDVLDLAVPLQATGLFEVMRIAHPPLAAMVKDHLDSMDASCA